MIDRPWTEKDQQISDKKLYFVLTVYERPGHKPVKHLWGPAPHSKAHKRRKAIELDFRLGRHPGALLVDVVRWRGEM